ncbi:MAG: hypothetical protein H5T64_10520 [Chloroflexi bacterium]|nr:hypothetical protein [Chloroflexota bacterium]
MLMEVRLGPLFLQTEEGGQVRGLIPRPPVDPALYERARSVVALSLEADLPVLQLGTMPLFSGHRVYCGEYRDWVLVNLAEDPLFHDRDGFPVPKRILRHLRAMQKAGVEFDALYVAHEVEKGRIREGGVTAEVLMPSTPKPVARLSGWLGTAARVTWGLAAAPLAASAVVSAAVAAGAVAVAPALMALGAACLTLDPILLGAVVAPGRPVEEGETAYWFYLAHWRYGEEE